MSKSPPLKTGWFKKKQFSGFYSFLCDIHIIRLSRNFCILLQKNIRMSQINDKSRTQIVNKPTFWKNQSPDFERNPGQKLSVNWHSEKPKSQFWAKSGTKIVSKPTFPDNCCPRFRFKSGLWFFRMSVYWQFLSQISLKIGTLVFSKCWFIDNFCPGFHSKYL